MGGEPFFSFHIAEAENMHHQGNKGYYHKHHHRYGVEHDTHINADIIRK